MDSPIILSARRLERHLGFPSWLACVGVGDGEIVLYTNVEPDEEIMSVAGDGWEGYAVKYRDCSRHAPAGVIH